MQRRGMTSSAPRTGLALLAAVLIPLAGCIDRSAIEPSEDPGGDPGGSDREVAIVTGGQIVFPSGALPEGTPVRTTAASGVTLVPGIEAAGDWFRIEIDAVLARPAELRLPIPSGSDPEMLTVVQVEDDGTQIILSTAPAGNEIVAHTPGTGTSAVYDLRSKTPARASNGARFITGILLNEPIDTGDGLPDLSPPVQGAISGPQFLRPEDRGRYHMNKGRGSSARGQALHWTAVGGEIVEGPEGKFAEVSRMDEGPIDLMVDYTCLESGTRGFAARLLSVQNDIPETSRLVVVGPASVDSGESFAATAGAGFGLTSLSWDFGDGNTGEMTPNSNLRYFLLPDHSYTEAGRYTIEVTGRSETLEANASWTIEVTEPRFEIVRTGVPSIPLGTLEIEDEIRNGLGPFSVQWQLSPGFTTDPTESAQRFVFREFTIDQPGTYYVTTYATDAVEREATFTSLVTVTGSEEVDAFVSVSTQDGFTGEPIAATLSMDGGILVTNGILRPYEVTLDWGDGETSTHLVEARSPEIGATMKFEHPYTTAGVYQVEAVVTDGHSNTAETTSSQITITGRDNYIDAIAKLDAVANGLDAIEIAFQSDFLSRWTNGCQTGCFTAISYAGATADPQVEARLDISIADDASVGTHAWGPDIDAGGVGELAFTSPRILTNRSGGTSLVIWELAAPASSGTITLEEFGSSSGSRVRGTFTANVRGMQSLDGGPAEEVTGAITGSFDLQRP